MNRADWSLPKGDRAAQKALYDRFSKNWWWYVSVIRNRLRGGRHLQEGFVKVFQGLGVLGKILSWKHGWQGIMVNTALNHHRKKLYLYPMVDVEDIDLPETEVSLSGLHFTQLLEMIQESAAGLPGRF